MTRMIKNPNLNESIEFYTNPSGTIVRQGELTASGNFKLLGSFAGTEYVGTNPEPGGSSPFYLDISHKHHQIIIPSAAISIYLPTTGVKAGQSWRITTRHLTSQVSIYSSAGGLITQLIHSSVELVAQVDTPTLLTDWYVIYGTPQPLGTGDTPTFAAVLLASNSRITGFYGNAAASASVNYYWPINAGSSGQYLQTDGAGNLSWQTVTVPASANPALSNLASVAINTALLPNGDNTLNLGSPSFGWQYGYINKLALDSNGQTTTIQGSASATASTTYSLPPADGSASQFLQTSGAGVLSWATVNLSSITLQTAYDNCTGGTATITTNSTDGSVVIAGDQSLKITATNGLDMTNKVIGTTTTNGIIVIQPNGTGALQASSSGDARGQYANDFQRVRSSTDMVASGDKSFIGGGEDNKIYVTNGHRSVIAGGRANSVTKDHSTIGGGYNNTLGASYGVIGGGVGNYLDNSVYATIGGGNTNSISGAATNALISGGYFNSVSAASASVLGGTNNTASHLGSTALGCGTQTSANFDLVVGKVDAASSTSNVHFRIAGNTSDVHIGMAVNQSAVSGATNTLFLHTINASNQSNSVGLKAPTNMTSSVSYTLPGTDGTVGTFLQTDGAANLSWGTAGDQFFASTMVGSVITFIPGRMKTSTGVSLISGNVTADSPASFTLNLSSVLAAPAVATTYWLYIDMAALPTAITLSDTGRIVQTVYAPAHFDLFTSDPRNVSPQRYIPMAAVRAPGGSTWTGSILKAESFKIHDTISSYFPLVEEKIYTTSTTSASIVFSHGLTGRPQIIEPWYWTNATSKYTLLPMESVINDCNSSTIDLNTNTITFSASDFLELRCYYVPKVSQNLASASTRFESQWYVDSLTTTIPHGLSDRNDIKSVSVIEWNTTSGVSRIVESGANIVTGFDDTNIYVAWGAFTPSATLKYKICTGSTALPTAVPAFVSGYTKWVGMGMGSYTSIASALAASAPGDAILIGTDQALAADLTISLSDLRIKTMPGVRLIFSAGTNGLKLTGNRIEVEAAIQSSASLTSMLYISGNDCHVAKTRMEAISGTQTQAVWIDATANRAYLEAATINNGGTITTKVTNNGTECDWLVRGSGA